MDQQMRWCESPSASQPPFAETRMPAPAVAARRFARLIRRWQSGDPPDTEAAVALGPRLRVAAI